MQIIRKIWNAINSLMVTAVVLLAVALVGVRLIGLTPYAVLSGSMEPVYHVGSLIYVKEIAPQEITVGTPITFVANSSGVLVTHRVIDVDRQTTRQEPVYDESGQMILDESGSPMQQEIPLAEPVYYYETKGDANEAADGAKVHHKNVVGTPVLTIPYLGYLSNWMQTPRGMVIGSSIALALLLITFIPDIADMLSDNPAPKKKAPPKSARPAKRASKRQIPKAEPIAGQPAARASKGEPEERRAARPAEHGAQAQSGSASQLPRERTEGRRMAQTGQTPLVISELPAQDEIPSADAQQMLAAEGAQAAPRRRRRRQSMPQEPDET